MRIGLGILISFFLLIGCSTKKPKVIVDSNETIVKSSVILEKNATVCTRVFKELEVDEENIIVNVFADELYFEKDKISGDKTQVVIKYLDAFLWEKKVLEKVYKKNQRLWSEEQSKEFKKILEEDRYLALCSEHRYWDNLEFEQGEPEKDILQSISLLKYLNNLDNGCPKWIASKSKNENSQKFLPSNEVLSLLAHGAIIDKLIKLYEPKDKSFVKLLSKHQSSLSQDEKKDLCYVERMEIEELKASKNHPNYKKRE